MRKVIRRTSVWAAVLAASLASTAPGASAQTAAPAVLAIGANDIVGVVTGPNGPEAGVWVIAETTDLPTQYAKIVVTDDQGRYVIPDLPARRTASGCAAMAWSIARSEPAGRDSGWI